MKILKFLAGLACLFFAFCAVPARIGICLLAAAILVYNGFRVERKSIRLAYYAGSAVAISFSNDWVDIIMKVFVVLGVIYLANTAKLADR